MTFAKSRKNLVPVADIRPNSKPLHVVLASDLVELTSATERTNCR